MTSSEEDLEEEDSEESEEGKMHVDGVPASGARDTVSKASALDVTDIAKPKTETRQKSPTPAANAGPGSPSSHK